MCKINSCGVGYITLASQTVYTLRCTNAYLYYSQVMLLNVSSKYCVLCIIWGAFYDSRQLAFLAPVYIIHKPHSVRGVVKSISNS